MLNLMKAWHVACCSQAHKVEHTVLPVVLPSGSLTHGRAMHVHLLLVDSMAIVPAGTLCQTGTDMQTLRRIGWKSSHYDPPWELMCSLCALSALLQCTDKRCVVLPMPTMAD